MINDYIVIYHICLYILYSIYKRYIYDIAICLLIIRLKSMQKISFLAIRKRVALIAACLKMASPLLEADIKPMPLRERMKLASSFNDICGSTLLPWSASDSPKTRRKRCPLSSPGAAARLCKGLASPWLQGIKKLLTLAW